MPVVQERPENPKVATCSIKMRTEDTREIPKEMEEFAKQKNSET